MTHDNMRSSLLGHHLIFGAGPRLRIVIASVITLALPSVFELILSNTHSAQMAVRSWGTLSEVIEGTHFRKGIGKNMEQNNSELV